MSGDPANIIDDLELDAKVVLAGINMRREAATPWKTRNVTLRIYARGTGKQLWSDQFSTGWSDESTTRAESLQPQETIRFSPDGKRIFVIRNSKEGFDLWIGRASDGDREHAIPFPTSSKETAAEKKGKGESDAAETPSGSTQGTKGTLADEPSYAIYPRILGFSPAGNLVTKTITELQVWNPNTGKLVQRLPHDGAVVHSVEFSADETRLFAMEEADFRPFPRSLHVWDLTTGQKLMALSAPALRPDDKIFGVPLRLKEGRFLFPDTGGLRIFDGTPAK